MHLQWESGPSPRWQFPNGTMFKKREGDIIRVAQKEFQLIKDLHESHRARVEEWKVVFEGVDLETFESVVIKFRYFLDQHAIDPARSARRCSRIDYSVEITALQSCQECRHFPRYIAHEEQNHSSQDPNPGAPVLILVESKIEGYPLFGHGSAVLSDYPQPLSLEDKEIIKKQCLDTLEFIRGKGFCNCLSLYNACYNRETKTLYFLRHYDMILDQRSHPWCLDSPVTESSPEYIQLIQQMDDIKTIVDRMRREGEEAARRSAHNAGMPYVDELGRLYPC